MNRQKAKKLSVSVVSAIPASMGIPSATPGSMVSDTHAIKKEGKYVVNPKILIELEKIVTPILKKIQRSSDGDSERR